MENKTPQIKIDEVFFIVYSTPSQITKTAKLSERENIVFQVLPRDLMDELNSICSDFEYHVKKVLRPVIRGKLYFIKYPLAKYKPKLDKLIMEYNEKLKEFADKVCLHLGEVKKTLSSFYQKYGRDRELDEEILAREHLHDRFRIKYQLLPIKLSVEESFPLLNKKEALEIDSSIRVMIEKSYQEFLSNELSHFFKFIEGQLKRLQNGKMVTAHALVKMRGMYDEVAQSLSIVNDARYKPAFELMGRLIGELELQHKRRKEASRKTAKKIADETSKTIGSIIASSKQIIDGLKEIRESPYGSGE